MKKEMWVNKSRSFEDAERFDSAYYLSLSSAERVETVQLLREQYFKAAGIRVDENGKRLRRVLAVVAPT
jgi:hypothetical protein